MPDNLYDVCASVARFLNEQRGFSTVYIRALCILWLLSVACS